MAARRAPRPVGIAASLVAGELAPATTLARVQGCWAGAVGPAVAAEAEPVAERAGIVTVACSSSVWAQELELASGDLLRRLNEAIGGDRERPPVRALRFSAGTLRPAR